LAASFTQLLLSRVVVAVGEAGCVPPAHSLIADYFNRTERPRAVAVYMSGGAVSSFVTNFLAGWLIQLWGWRPMFVMIGLPGLVPAALAWFTLKEPRRDLSAVGAPSAMTLDHARPAADGRIRMREVLVTLWGNHTFRRLLLVFSAMSFFGSGILQWQPAFFMRSYGMKSGELGMWFAVIYGLGGIFGTFWGGTLATSFAANKESLQLKSMAVVTAVLAFASCAIYLSPNHYLAFGFMALTAVGACLTISPTLAMIQTLVPPQMRATSIAGLYLFANLIGTGLGPLASGALSDAFRPWAGDESLRYALLVLCPGYLWGAWHLWKASGTVDTDLVNAQGQRGPVAGSEDFLAGTSAKRA